MTIPILLIFVLAVPQPKPAEPAGRITVWVGDKFVHFKPDGTDAKTVDLPDGYPVSATSTPFPDRTSSVLIDPRGTDPTKGIDRGQLVLAPLAEKEAYYVLDGYVVLRMVLSADGRNVYFVGAKGEELPRTLKTVPGNFVLDVATKEVKEISLPEKHTLEAVSPDGKTFVTSRVDADLVNYTRKTYLTPAAGGEPVEVFGPNVFPSHLRFSPDGSKLLARRAGYESVYSNGKGGFRSEGAKPWEYVVVDVGSRKETKLALPEETGVVLAWDWSPDGTKVVYLRPAGREVVATACDADGKNGKEIFRTAGKPDRVFVMWR